MSNSDSIKDAFEEFIGEIEWMRSQITHPNGRRANYIDSQDQVKVDALTELIDKGNALLAKEQEHSDAL